MKDSFNNTLQIGDKILCVESRKGKDRVMAHE